MLIESRAANCFSATFVLKSDGRPVGKFEERWLSEGLDVQMIGGRRFQFRKADWLSSRFVLTDGARERPLGGGFPSGLLSSGWELDLSGGPGRLEWAGWFASAFEYERGGRVLARVDRLGTCARGWVVEGHDSLTRDDLLVIGLVYHVISRRQAQQNQASTPASGA